MEYKHRQSAQIDNVDTRERLIVSLEVEQRGYRRIRDTVVH